MLLSLVVVFTSVVILFFVGIIAYSKAYKAKNKIIEIIEKHDGNISGFSVGSIDDNVESAMNESLRLMGYRVSESDEPNCASDSSRGTCTNLNSSEFYYCICEHSNAALDSATTFEVITYVQFEFPIIGDLLTFPVKGETRVLGKDYNYD